MRNAWSYTRVFLSEQHIPFEAPWVVTNPNNNEEFGDEWTMHRSWGKRVFWRPCMLYGDMNVMLKQKHEPFAFANWVGKCEWFVFLFQHTQSPGWCLLRNEHSINGFIFLSNTSTGWIVARQASAGEDLLLILSNEVLPGKPPRNSAHSVICATYEDIGKKRTSGSCRHAHHYVRSKENVCMQIAFFKLWLDY